VVEFTVYDRKDSAPVGTAGLLGIHHADGTAELGIFLGERRGQGLGTEATRLVLDFAFNVLQLRNVLLETLEWNAAGLAAYERAGFRRIGVRRGARIKPRATHRRRAHGRRPARLRRVGAALTRTHHRLRSRACAL
jgi:RimJ/RimL family protein N-acetyltransferase